jgi:hypothetical protein
MPTMIFIENIAFSIKNSRIKKDVWKQQKEVKFIDEYQRDCQ